jgi:hypothetical protein
MTLGDLKQIVAAIEGSDNMELFVRSPCSHSIHGEEQYKVEVCFDDHNWLDPQTQKQALVMYINRR